MGFKDPIKAAVYYKKWRLENKAYISDYRIKYQRDHKDELAFKRRLWEQKNREKLRIKKRRHPRVCEVCNKHFLANHKDTRFCNRRCMGTAFAGKEYKRWRVGSKIMQEHRFLMEQFLGRKLLKNEVIHHINGNKRDNRIENLRIMNNSDHTKLHRAMDGKTNSKN